MKLNANDFSDYVLSSNNKINLQGIKQTGFYWTVPYLKGFFQFNACF